MTQLNLLIEKGKSKYGSYGELAKAIGVPQQHISMWKKGNRTCSAPDRAALAVAVGEDPATAALEAVMEGIDLEKPQGARATHAIQLAIKRVAEAWQHT